MDSSVFVSSLPFLTIGNLLKVIGEGSKQYEEGKNMLKVAIGEYDQAVFDLTASVVAGNGPNRYPPVDTLLDMKYELQLVQQRKEYE